MSRPSKRFKPSRWTDLIVPSVLFLILLGLVMTVALVIVSILGLTPGF